MATEEIWVPIQGSNGAYEISNQGRIRSIPRKVLRRGYGEYPVRGRILKPCTAVGYYAYWVYIEGKGNVYYQGSPVIDSEITGSGKLIPEE